MNTHGWMLGLVVVMLSALPGCGGGSGTPVGGTVVREGGEPIPYGAITFTSQDGPTVTFAIQDGEFSSAKSDVGVEPGPQEVTVSYPPAGAELTGEVEDILYETEITIPEGGKTDLKIEVPDEPESGT